MNVLFDYLSQDIWERYGLMGNPFDTKALSAVPEENLLISEAIVGRGIDTSEFRMLANIFKVSGGARVVVEGEIGVGKTTFVNYQRFLWEYQAKDKLFSPYREMSVLAHWNLRDFLLNILGSLIIKLNSCNKNIVTGQC